VIATRTAALIAAVAVLGTVAPGAYAQSLFSITQDQSNTAFGSSTGGSNSMQQENRQYTTVTNDDVLAVASQIGTTLLLY
jgi:hypothetical protein